MAEEKFTPKPWEFDGDVYIFGPANEMVAEVRGYGEDLPQKANGYLIAAAPELLEACKFLVEMIIQIPVDRTQDYAAEVAKDARLAFEQGQSAIQKATGGELDG